MNKATVTLGVTLWLIVSTGCTGVPDENSSASSNASMNSSAASNSSYSSAPISSSSLPAESDTTALAGAWLITTVAEKDTNEKVIYIPHFAEINDTGKLLLTAPCFVYEFQWNNQSNHFHYQQEISAHNCEASDQSIQLAQLIDDANSVVRSNPQMLTMAGNDFSLQFESYTPTCVSPLSWPNDVTFSPEVQLSFASASQANRQLKPFILEHRDFDILSWEQACISQNTERVNVKLNLKTLNELRCTGGVNAFTFLEGNGGQP